MREPKTSDCPIGLIVNPHARRAGRYLLRDRFWERYLPRENVYITQDLQAAEAAAGELARRGMPVIACLGGDGTLHNLVNARAMRGTSSSALLPLAGGTLNGLAKAFGCGGKPQGVLAKALAAKEVRTFAQPTLHITGPIDKIGFTMAGGLALPAARSYDQSRRKGSLALLRVVAEAAMGRLMCEKVDLTVDGEGPARAILMAAGTVTKPFLFVRPFGPHERGGKGFSLVSIGNLPDHALARLWPILRGQSRDREVSYRHPQRAVLKRCPGIVLDGEIHRFSASHRLQVDTGSDVKMCDLRHKI